MYYDYRDVFSYYITNMLVFLTFSSLIIIIQYNNTRVCVYILYTILLVYDNGLKNTAVFMCR